MFFSDFLRFSSIVATLYSLLAVGQVASLTSQTINPGPDPKYDSNSISYSYGVGFVDGRDTFINTASRDEFTCVSSTPSGCNQDETEEVLFIDPAGDESSCAQIPTSLLDDNTSQLSTCPIAKTSMVATDDYTIFNGNGQPYLWYTCGERCKLELVTF
jgi:hypothetical protein